MENQDKENFSDHVEREEEGFSASLSAREEENFDNHEDDDDEDFEVEGFKL